MLIPRDPSLWAIIIEFKKVSSGETLRETTQKALTQIVMPMQYAGVVLNQLNTGISDLSDSCKVRALKLEIDDVEGDQELVAEFVALDFEHVSFHYQ